MLSLLLTLAGACHEPLPPDPTISTAPADSAAWPNGRCAARGQTHTQTAHGTWRASDGPHRFASDLTIRGTLTLEAGTLVCAGGGARLIVDSAGKLVVRGSEAAPVVLTAGSTAVPWGGIVNVTTGTLSMSHVLLEYARAGILGAVTLDHARMRRIVGTAVEVDLGMGKGTLSDVTIDTAGGGVSLAYASASLLRVVMHRVGSGVFCDRSTLAAVGLHIEDSRQALTLGYNSGRWCTLVLFSGAALVRDSILGVGDLGVIASIFATDSVIGGGVWFVPEFFGRTIPGDVTVPGGVELRVADDYGPPAVIRGHGTLTLSPGTRFAASNIALDTGVRIVARGSESAPVLITLGGSARFGGAGGRPSVFSHIVLLGNGRLVADSGRALLLDSSRVTGGGSVFLRSPGSRILDSIVEDAYATGYSLRAEDSSAVLLGADGVSMRQTMVLRSHQVGVRITAPGVVIEGCEVSGGAGDGIVASAAERVQVHQCNISGNAGVGLRNNAAATLDARSNWWGDPAGPSAPGASGVSGNVDASSPLGSPFLLRPAAPGGPGGYGLM